MNYAIVFRLLGYILMIEGTLLLLPAVTSLIYAEWAVMGVFLLTAAISGALGFALRTIKPRSKVFYMREGFAATALSWITISIMGAVPFVLTGCIPNPVDAMFETVSGFTTTGASILPGVEDLPKGILFWRSFTHWIGGMGVLVFLLSLLPLTGGSEKFIEEGERGSLAVRFVVFAILLRVAALAEQAFQSIHRLGHLTVEVLKVILGESHPLDHIIDRLDAHLLGAFEAKALVDGFSAVDLRYKNDCKILFAS